MTKRQKHALGNLLADHRNFEGCADYLDSPTMRAVFEFVDRLMKRKKCAIPECPSRRKVKKETR